MFQNRLRTVKPDMKNHCEAIVTEFDPADKPHMGGGGGACYLLGTF